MLVIATAKTELAAEVELGLISIVSAASELDVLDRRFSTGSVGHDVMELEERPRCTSVPILCSESALTAVARPHRPPDLGRNVT